MTVATTLVTRKRQELSPFAYLKNDKEKRLVEVRWVEGDVVTVHDCADRDEASTFEITRAEIGKWTQVIPAKDK